MEWMTLATQILGLLGAIVKAWVDHRNTPAEVREREEEAALHAKAEFEKALASGNIEYLNEVIRRNRVGVEPRRVLPQPQ